MRKVEHFRRKSLSQRLWVNWPEYRRPRPSWKTTAGWFTFYTVGLSILFFYLPDIVADRTGPASAHSASSASAYDELTIIRNAEQLPTEDVVQRVDVSFNKCIRGAGYNCVIDGDTFRYRGERIRIADINTPETYKPQCDYEARLGEQATNRLQELLNTGPFSLQGDLRQDEDRYGRKLRYVVRDGQSIGDILVSEGLAHRWTGYRKSWCT